MIKRMFIFKDKKSYKKFCDRVGSNFKIVDNNNNGDAIITMQLIINELIHIERRFSGNWSSSEKTIYNKARQGADKIISIIKSKGVVPEMLGTFLHFSELKKLPGANTRIPNIIKLLNKLR